MRYDPYRDPEPKAWLKMDEQERLAEIERYHRKKGIKLPSLRMHAVMHTIAENQIAMADQIPVRAKLQQLMAEGLDRHDAVHAIGTIMAYLMHGIMTGKIGGDPNAYYLKKLEKLTAEWWLKNWDHADADTPSSHAPTRVPE
jgi:hypothetical protein